MPHPIAVLIPSVWLKTLQKLHNNFELLVSAHNRDEADWQLKRVISLILVLALTIFSSAAHASPLDEVKEQASKGNFATALQMFDGALDRDDAASAEAQYVKGHISFD